jgi:hypothetical protein
MTVKAGDAAMLGKSMSRMMWRVSVEKLVTDSLKRRTRLVPNNYIGKYRCKEKGVIDGSNRIILISPFGQCRFPFGRLQQHRLGHSNCSKLLLDKQSHPERCV